MGLAERRAVKAFQDTKYPKIKQEIDAVAGFAVTLDVQWDTLAAEGYAEYYEDAFPKVFFRPLIEALKGVCVDDLGKEALQAGLKKVIIADNGGNEVSFQFGTLSISYYAVANLDYWTERKTEIQTILEKGL
jgi:hypothetical protein